ncbi:NADH-quinone oxidoreductase subunit I [Terrabacter sp. LjRoot27]|uniref:NuoI/complex I 23 kDa subunit family protein n=1 Tax=Terrabacter sp. LjRoot27 TaxID=3342306 RepID=UPI003ECF588E
MADGIIPGLVKGLATTAKSLTRHTHTAEYPDVSPALPPRSRGVIALTEENCTSCMLCARECPDWCIYIDSHKEELPPTTPGGRARQRNVLDRFAIDFSLCMYCGICIEVCPFDALHWSPEFEYAETDIRDLLHEKDRLGAWMATVPAPPALDPGSADPAEVTAAAKPARGSAGGDAGGTRGAGAAARPTRVRRETTTPPAAAPAQPAPAQPAPAQPAVEQTRVMPAVEPAAQSAAEQTRVMPAVEPAAQPSAERTAPLPAAERTASLPAAEETSVLPPADGAEAEQAADRAAAQGDSTQVMPTVSTDEEGSE